MTEKEFDRRVEAAAGRFEQRVEAAADRFDKGITRVWEKNKLFRAAIRAVSLAVEAGLIVAAAILWAQGHPTGAAWCLGLGLLGIAADVIKAVVFKKE